MLTLSAEDRAQLLAAALAALRLAVLVVSAALLDAAAVAVDGVALAALVVSAAEAVTLALVALVATEPPHAARDTPTAAVRPAPLKFCAASLLPPGASATLSYGCDHCSTGTPLACRKTMGDTPACRCSGCDAADAPASRCLGGADGGAAIQQRRPHVMDDSKNCRHLASRKKVTCRLAGYR